MKSEGRWPRDGTLEEKWKGPVAYRILGIRGVQVCSVDRVLCLVWGLGHVMRCGTFVISRVEALHVEHRVAFLNRGRR